MTGFSQKLIDIEEPIEEPLSNISWTLTVVQKTGIHLQKRQGICTMMLSAERNLYAIGLASRVALIHGRVETPPIDIGDGGDNPLKNKREFELRY